MTKMTNKCTVDMSRKSWGAAAAFSSNFAIIINPRHSVSFLAYFQHFKPSFTPFVTIFSVRSIIIIRTIFCHTPFSKAFTQLPPVVRCLDLSRAFYYFCIIIARRVLYHGFILYRLWVVDPLERPTTPRSIK